MCSSKPSTPSYQKPDPTPTVISPTAVNNGDKSGDTAVASKKKKGFTSTNTSDTILGSSEGKRTLG